MAAKRKCGHPPKTNIDRLAAKMWATAVSIQSGMSHDQLEQFFDSRLRGNQIAVFEPSRIWRKYSNGVAPRQPKSGRPSIVDVAEQAFPGTAQWLRSPLWAVLKKQELGYQQMTELVTNCREEVRELFSINAQASKASEALKINVANWNRLVSLESFEAFGCMVLFCRFESRQGAGYSNWRTRGCRWWLHGNYQRSETIRTHKDELVQLFHEFAPELGDLTFLGNDPPDNEEPFAEMIFNWLFSRD